MNRVPPKECYEEYGKDLDGCSRQENEGCSGCRCLVIEGGLPQPPKIDAGNRFA